jgi:hypothetical protein
MDIQALVTEFANSVAAQREAIASGDSAVGNAYAKRYIAAFKILRAHGDDGRDALAGLFTHERADVRVAAASFLLRHCGDKARELLEREAQGRDLVAFGAAQALKRWREGTWALDPE